MQSGIGFWSSLVSARLLERKGTYFGCKTKIRIQYEFEKPCGRGEGGRGPLFVDFMFMSSATGPLFVDFMFMSLATGWSLRNRVPPFENRSAKIEP